jgi:hypothetical protein
MLFGTISIPSFFDFPEKALSGLTAGIIFAFYYRQERL